MLTKLRGLLALVGLAAIVIGMPALLIAAAPIGTLSITWTPEGIWQALTTPDNGTIALTLFKLVGWAAWAVLTAAILLELAGLIRQTPVPRLPGLAMPQLMARGLVATAAVLFIATGSLTAGELSTADVALAAGGAAQPVPAHAIPGHAQPSETHPSTDKSRTYTVKKGDTLSEIALEHTGRAANYPKLFKASTHTVQPGGRHLTDPDEIDIGWKITIPADTTKHTKPAKEQQTKTTDTTAATTPSPSATARAQDPSTQPATDASRPASAPAASQTGTQTAPVTAQAEPPVAEPSTDAAPTASESPAWVLSGLAGVGALLAGGLLLALNRRRAAQFRHRRPGRMIAVPPPETIAVEKTLIREGSPTGAVVLFIDEVLRRTTSALTTTGQPVPVLVGVDAHPDHLTLRLAGPADLPEVWNCLDGDARQIWRIPADADLEQVGPLEQDGAPPWPQLVTLGQDAAGWRLINLEAIGVATLTGDPVFCGDLARYLVTELAVSPWARDVDIDCLAICADLPGLAPDRVHFHTRPDIITDRVAYAVATTDRLTNVQPATLETARVTFAADDLWDSRLLISASTDAEHLHVLTRLITDQKGRTATAVLLVGPDQPPTGMEIRLTSTGRVQVPALDLNLVANGLTEDEARGCVSLMTAGHNLDDREMPAADEPGHGDWEEFCNEAGAVRADLTVPRDSDVADTTSVLPEPDPTYLAETANTAEDLADLSPKVPVVVSESIEAADPTLDADLADWWATTCVRPRLQVLGPIKVRVGTTGEPLKAASRMPSCTEAVAFLSTRPRGATTPEVADALGISEGRVRQDMSIVRAWLGDNPATGRKFLPGATESPQAVERGVGLYLIEDLLCDADLFKRLRLRGEARGPDGIDDLRTALRLVNGAPYDGLRARGGSWLAENRHDQYLLCSIVDVAHLVSTIALAAGNLQQARAAAELAVLTAPAEATPQLDLAAVAAKSGDHSRAADIARSVVRWRDASGEPVDLSERNDAILRTHRWLEKTSRAS